MNTETQVKRLECLVAELRRRLEELERPEVVIPAAPRPPYGDESKWQRWEAFS